MFGKVSLFLVCLVVYDCDRRDEVDQLAGGEHEEIISRISPAIPVTLYGLTIKVQNVFNHLNKVILIIIIIIITRWPNIFDERAFQFVTTKM